MDLELVPLDRHRHDRSLFRCGQPSLDRYLREQATQDLRRQLSSVYVLADRASGRIIGYYTLSASSIQPDELPPTLTKRLPRYAAYPAALVGRLAVDDAFQGNRFGTRLLVDALGRSLGLVDQLGIFAVVVEAIDDRASAFYHGFGFTPYESDESLLFITISDVRSLGLARS